MNKDNRFLGSKDNLLLFLMMLSLCLGISHNDVIKYLVILIGLLEVLIILTYMRVNIKYSYPVVLIWGIWSGYVCTLLFLDFSVPFVSVTVQQIVLCMLWFFNYRISDNINYMQWVDKCQKMLVFFLIADALYFIRYSYDFFGVPIMGLSFFAAVKSKKRDRLFLLLVIVLFLVKGRSTALALIVIWVTQRYIGKVQKKRRVCNILYWMMACITVYFPKVYCSFFESQYAIEVNRFVRQYTGKNLFSGRERLWIDAYELIEESPIFGMGGKFVGRENELLGMSTHNLFIFLRLEGGYVLLLLFLLAMFYVWTQINKNMDYEYKALSVAYIVGLFVRVSFDLTFLANNFGQSIMLWIPIVFILNRCHNNHFKAKKIV